MRKVLVLVAMSAACGDDGNNGRLDAGPIGDSFVMPDAQPMIDGVWRDTYYTSTGPVTTPSCTSAPTAIQIDASNGSINQYPGTCKADGTFEIKTPSTLGTYYLRVGGVFYETNKSMGIDLSTDRLGRSDVAAITGVTLDMTITNMQAWTSSDVLVAFGANVGYRQNLILTSGTPAAAATALMATAAWNGYKIEGSKSDLLQILQLGKHTTGGSGYDFNSLDRVFNAQTFTMANNAAQTIGGAFGSATAGSVNLSVDVASFNQFANVAGPSVTQKTVQGTAYATASTDAIDSPPLVTFARASDNLTTMSFGSLSYTDPFPAGWARMVKVAVGFVVPYSYNGATGALTAQVVRVVTKAAAEAGTLAANVGPPTQVELDADPAFTDDVITQVPLLSWSAPTVGNATDYELQVYEVKKVATSLTFTSVLRMVTKQTSVRIPQGYLLGQRQYVFSVRARNRVGVDIYATPLHNGAQYSSADTLSAIVTTN